MNKKLDSASMLSEDIMKYAYVKSIDDLEIVGYTQYLNRLDFQPQ